MTTPGLVGLAGALGVSSIASDGTAVAERSQIYVYKLPTCSFDDFDPELIEGRLKPNPPILPMHRSILHSKYVTQDPAAATLFYIPAPFVLWTNALECSPVHKPPFHASTDPQHFNGRVSCFESVQSIIGNGARTISIWTKLEPGSAQNRTVLVSTGVGNELNSFDLGLLQGCPAILSCRCQYEHVPPCKRRVDDGHWHHLAITYDGKTSRIYLDGVAIEAKRTELNTSAGVVCYGGRPSRKMDEQNPTDCNCTANRFYGDSEGLRLFDYSLTAEAVQFKHGGFSTSRSPCFREVRRHIETSPWFQRSGGWDHFLIQGSLDYPVCFTFDEPNKDEHYIFERLWPAFGNFAILHVGARAEICAAHHIGEIAKADAACWRRFFRMITVPPILDGEDFDCNEMAARLHIKRPVRVAYRGLAYGAMYERVALKTASKSPLLHDLSATGQVVLEFTNWTHEAVKNGQCNKHQAFAGLCPWSRVGRHYKREFGSVRKTKMKTRSLQLWPQSDFCLVMPGDGGYELRLYSMMNLGCIPVIIYTSGRTLPKIPFARSLPWHEFAIFWDLNHRFIDHNDAFYGVQGHARSALQLLTQLLGMDAKTIRRKREALHRYAPSFAWTLHASCTPNGKHNNNKGLGVPPDRQQPTQVPSAVDLIVEELAHRAEMSQKAAAGDASALRFRDFLRKVPLTSMDESAKEDLSGNSCPAGYPVCESHVGEKMGDVCHAHVPGVGHACPAGCEMVTGPPNCIVVSKRKRLRNSTKRLLPCRVSRCSTPALMEPNIDNIGLPADKSVLRILIISFSTRPELRQLTWPSLHRFCDAHKGRYELELYTEPLLDPRDFHPAWNKLAFVRRAFVMETYHAVVWIDDDILITEPTRDPIFENLVSQLLPYDDKVVLAARDDAHVSPRYPLNSGLLVWKRGWDQKHLIDELFEIGHRGRAYMLGNDWLQPSHNGFWDQDAMAIYAKRHSAKAFAVLPHRSLQSYVRQKGAQRSWKQGDFAAHFTGIRKYELLIRTVQEFMLEHNIPFE